MIAKLFKTFWEIFLCLFKELLTLFIELFDFETEKDGYTAIHTMGVVITATRVFTHKRLVFNGPGTHDRRHMARRRSVYTTHGDGDTAR